MTTNPCQFSGWQILMNKSEKYNSIKLLSILGIVLSSMFISGCGQEKVNQLSRENVRLTVLNESLKIRCDSLLQVVQALSETAEYHYKHAIDSYKNGNLDSAKSEFKIIIEKFPTNQLAGNAKNKIAIIDSELAQIAAERAKQESEENAKKSLAEKIESMEFTPYNEIILTPTKYISKLIKIAGTFSYKSTDRNSFYIADGDNSIEVFMDNLSIEKRREILNSKDYSHVLVTVVGHVMFYSNNFNSYYIRADYVGIE
jgi:hypothetical protein